MEFIKRMRKREFIEMGLKTLACVLAGLILAILLEAMIYHIYLGKIKDNASLQGSTFEYYIMEQDDNTYDIISHGMGENGFSQWGRRGDHKGISKTKLDSLLKDKGVIYNENANLYKIVAKHGSDSVEYVNGASTAYEQIKANADLNNGEYTFDIYIKANAEDGYSETATKANLTYQQLMDEGTDRGELKKNNVSAVYWRAPNCFEIYMNGWHYAIIVLVELIICGLFTWRFVLIGKEYQKIEKRFKKTGKVF